MEHHLCWKSDSYLKIPTACYPCFSETFNQDGSEWRDPEASENVSRENKYQNQRHKDLSSQGSRATITSYGK